MRQPKLYTFTSADFESYSHLTPNGDIVTIPADNIPMLRWPDNRWCWAANIYILNLFEQGLSRKDGGSTLKTYATQISHLIRYCFFNQVDFTDLTDDQFTFFIKSLQGERRPADSALVREADTVISIGRICLDFLSSAAQSYGVTNFIGPKGQIIAERREYKISGDRSYAKTIIRNYWHHRSFPTADPKKRRLPIDSSTIAKLQDAVLPASSSIFLRKRRYVMLRLLEITGARRSEVAALTTKSVFDAAKLDYPMLRLTTRKKGGNREHVRLVPILLHDVEFLLEFIEKNRYFVIKKTCGKIHDDGYVLISETTGKRLRPNTITQEIGTLRSQASVTAKACAHMFRHRYITKLFIALIEQHRLENEDEFRRGLIDNEQLKQQIREYTGHTQLNSLDHYIHIAFSEFTNFGKTTNAANAKHLIESLVVKLRHIKNEIRQDLSSIEASLQIERFLLSAIADLNQLH